MKITKTSLLKFNNCRLYVLDIITYKFKKYIVCLDFTTTIANNNEKFRITILTKTEGDKFKSIVDDDLYTPIYAKCEENIINNKKNIIKSLGDKVFDHNTGLEQDELLILIDYLKYVIE